MCERYIDSALRRPSEYELYCAHQYEFLRAARVKGRGEMPVFEWGLQRFAEPPGKSPEERMRVLLAVWALAHGTATLLIAKATPPEVAKELRAAGVNAVEDLLRAAKDRAR